MDKRKVEHYRKQLLAKQEDFRRMVVRSDQDGREADGEITQDTADRAANSYNKELLFHQSDDNRRILQLIEDAIRRAENGSFGHCVECQQDVQIKRLDAVPWARHCISCQEKQEKGLL